MKSGKKSKKYTPTNKTEEVFVEGATYGTVMTVFLFGLLLCNIVLNQFLDPRLSLSVILLILCGFGMGFIIAIWKR